MVMFQLWHWFFFGGLLALAYGCGRLLRVEAKDDD